jgi:hypothetical protein
MCLTLLNNPKNTMKKQIEIENNRQEFLMWVKITIAGTISVLCFWGMVYNATA